jgi:hypothetical protein
MVTVPADNDVAAESECTMPVVGLTVAIEVLLDVHEPPDTLLVNWILARLHIPNEPLPPIGPGPAFTVTTVVPVPQLAVV